MSYCNYNVPNDCLNKLNKIKKVLQDVKEGIFTDPIFNTPLFSKYKDKKSKESHKQEIITHLNKMEKYYTLKQTHFKEFQNTQPLQPKSLKGINMFIDPSNEHSYRIDNKTLTKQQLLDPTWGFLWSMNAIKNYHKFGLEPLKSVVKTLFASEANGNILVPTKFINISSKDIGIFLGCLFNQLTSSKTTHLKKIDKNKPDNEKYWIKIRNKIFKLMIKHSNLIKYDFRIHLCDLKLNCKNGKPISEKDLSEDCKKIPKYKLKNKCQRERTGLTRYFEIQNKTQIEKFIDVFIQLYIQSKSDTDKPDTDKQHLIHFFHIFLTYLIFTCKDKNGIWEYYKGIEMFVEEGVSGLDSKNKNRFVNDEYNIEKTISYVAKNDTKINYSLEYLFLLYVTHYRQSVTTQLYNHNSPFYNVKFSDCGAASIRNFFKIILYNSETNRFDTSRLEYLKANPNLIEYFKIFDQDVYFTNLSSIESLKKKSKHFKLKDTVETAWNRVVQDLKDFDIRYHRKIEIEKKDIWYEIASGFNKTNTLPNLLCVFKALFKDNKECAKAETFEDIFEIILNEYNEDKGFDLFDIYEETSPDGFGNIDISNSRYKFNYVLDNGHFFIDNYKIHTNIKYNIGHESYQNMKHYFNQYVNHIRFRNSFLTNENFLFQNLNENNYPVCLNILEPPFYGSLLKYITSLNNIDLMRRIELDLTKFDISILNEIDFSEFNIEYKHSKDVNYTLVINNLDENNVNDLSQLQNLREMNIKCECIIGKNIKLPLSLQALRLYNYHRKDLKESLDLTNIPLKKLRIGESCKFNQVIALPNTLELLSLNRSFENGNDTKLDLSGLHNLKKLYFEKYSKFNKFLILPNSLRDLYLGRYFNNGQDSKQFDVSNTDLIKLEFNEISKFNKQLVLPTTIAEIRIGKYFTNNNQLFDLSRFEQLDTLHFTEESTFNSELRLPNSLMVLDIGKNFNNGSSDIFDLSNIKIYKFTLKSDYVFNSILKLPSTLKNIYIHSNIFNNGKGALFDISNTKIREMIFKKKSTFDKKIKIPKSLVYLELGAYFNNGNHSIFDLSDSNLQELLFQYDGIFNKKLLLPDSLVNIQFGNKFNNGDGKIFDVSNTKIKILDFDPYKKLIKETQEDTKQWKKQSNFTHPTLLGIDLDMKVEDSVFNKALKVPKTLLSLRFGYKFNNGNADIFDLSHTSVDTIELSKFHRFNKHLKLPKTLRTFTSHGHFNNGEIPLNLTNLEILKTLYLLGNFNQPILFGVKRELMYVQLNSNYLHDIDLSSSFLYNIQFFQFIGENKTTLKIKLPNKKSTLLRKFNSYINRKNHIHEITQNDWEKGIIHIS